MKSDDVILQRQKMRTRFKNGDMDFTFAWELGAASILGMMPSHIYMALDGIRDGDPDGWRDGFRRQGDLLAAAAGNSANGELVGGQFAMAAAYAYRAALQYTDPASPVFQVIADSMESAFSRGAAGMRIPVRPVEIPYAGASLPGYYLQIDEELRPLVVMIGGGDTFREDLFYFAGYPGWKRGYNVIMVDLPGQGRCPARGLHFQVDMHTPVSLCIDWVRDNSAAAVEQVAVYGVSGGGYFSAQVARADPRVSAWIAATPIFDIAELFRREFGSALKAPGWLMNTILKAAGLFNRGTAVSLSKYAWQFGTQDFTSAIEEVFRQARIVDCTGIACPSLFLLSEGEGPELVRQTRVLYDSFRERGVDVTLREFTAGEGADAHCQVNNLRYAHAVVFDWLDARFGYGKDRDPRLVV